MIETIHMSPTRAFNFEKNPRRALDDYIGATRWFEGNATALLYGTIVHNIAEGRDSLEGIPEEDRKLLISSKGTTKGQLKSTYKEAEIVGNHLHKYVGDISDDQTEFERPLKELNQLKIDDHDIAFNVTGRADMLTANTVYDFKTVAPNDFQGFLDYGSFRDHREVNYMRQVAFYAHMFDKRDAHIIYIKKSKDTPFIFDYQLTDSNLYDGWQDINRLITEAVGVIIRGKEHAQAVNDGSAWAFKYFGGVVNGN